MVAEKPIVRAQGALDGTWVEPPLEPMPTPTEPPEGLHDLRQVAFPNPEPTRKPWTKPGERGEATVSLETPENQDAQGDYWAWARACSNRHPLPRRLQEVAVRRTERVRTCGRKWRYPKCRGCGHKLKGKARLREGCDAMTCVFCARRVAQSRRAKLHAWCEKLEAHRGTHKRDFYSITWTIPKRPWLSMTRLQEDSSVVWKSVKKTWEKELCKYPRKANAKGPRGKCPDAGMVAFEEISPGGMVHVSALYYGPWHHVEDLFAIYKETVPGGKNFEVEAVGSGPDRKKKMGKFIAEVCKYVTKGTVGGRDEERGEGHQRHEFTHPLLCILSELALYERNRVRCYGSAIGVLKERDDEEEEPESKLPEQCPCCGEVRMERRRDEGDPMDAGHLVNALWEWVEEERAVAWTPKGWGGGRRGRDRAPPGAPK